MAGTTCAFKEAVNQGRIRRAGIGRSRPAG